MINLGQISAKATKTVEEIRKENNLPKENLFVERIIEVAKGLSSVLKSQAETIGSPKEREICLIKEEEVKLYIQTKDRIIIKVKELYGDSCSIYLYPKVTRNYGLYEYIEPCINLTWDGKERKDDTTSEFGSVTIPDYYGGLGTYYSGVGKK